MKLRRVFFLISGLVALIFLASGGLGWQHHPFRVLATEAKDTKVKALLKERHAILQKVAAAAGKSFRVGRISIIDLIEANRAALNAELDLCVTDKERVAVLERMLAGARENEKYVKQGVERAQFADVELLRATAARLEVEIALERAKGK